ncbi:MAG: response regulator [Phycisphaerales bacterium]|nr:response regulator [Phycisphaerales bacterium]
MPKRKPKDGFNTNADREVRPGEPARPAGTPEKPARVLCVDGEPGAADLVADSLHAASLCCDRATTLGQARRLLDAHDYDVMVIDVRQLDGSPFDLIREQAEAGRPVRSVLTCTRPNVRLSVDAMRCGAVDLLVKPIVAGELLQRLTLAVEQARRLRRESKRLERLKRMCRRLHQDRAEVSRQVDVLCNDLVEAYEELAGRRAPDEEPAAPAAAPDATAGLPAPAAGPQAAYADTIRAELDVESLLRKTLEYLLTRTGPTNAAVFLPTGHTDWSLGAYVNYDVPKDTVDVLLDHLAGVVGPRLADEESIAVSDAQETLARIIGDDAHWLAESSVVMFSCRHAGECLAVGMLFRDQRKPYSDEVIAALEGFRGVFAAQLSRVVTVHNRHRKHSGWRGFHVDDDADEDRGMAA